MRARYVQFVCQGLWIGVLAILIPGVDAAKPTIGQGSGGQGSGASPSIQGVAIVSDGDTITIDGVRVRLEGIDAPELGQTCQRSQPGGVTTSWACGQAARFALDTLIGGRSVACHATGTDVYGRLLGRCVAGGVDLNDRMVRDGFAWAFVKYSQVYVATESEARRRRVGVWQGEAEAPWTYRERKWTAEAPAAPSGCAIKGKITVNGHIYHTPWSPWYAQSRIDERRGERWFCSEGEALAAGWRPAAFTR